MEVSATTLVVIFTIILFVKKFKPKPACFEDLVFIPGSWDGIEIPMHQHAPIEELQLMSFTESMWGRYAQIYFGNGFGASVVCHGSKNGGSSYGASNGLYEIALIRSDNKMDNLNISYMLEMFRIDVLGHHSESEVTEVLKEIQGSSAIDLISKLRPQTHQW